MPAPRPTAVPVIADPIPAPIRNDAADGAAQRPAGQLAENGPDPAAGPPPANGPTPANAPTPARGNGQADSRSPGFGHAPSNGRGGRLDGSGDRPNGCTAPQLRRFIKSRPYVPMHELRRRFAIDGGDDDVTQVRLADGHIYVGLPSREGSLLGELLRGGEIGYELSLDPRTPVVVGVYPMRPIPRG